MTNKKFLLLSTSITAFTAAGLAIVVASGIKNNSAQHLAAENAVESSITFDSTTAKTKLDDTKYSFAGQTTGGNTVYLISKGQGLPGHGPIGSMYSANYDKNYIVFSVVQGQKEEETLAPGFQNIRSISITTASGTQTNNFKIYNSLTGSEVYSSEDSSSTSKTTTVTTEVEGSSYIRITSGDPTKWLDISSVTVTYTCKSIEGKEPVALLLNGGTKSYQIGSSFSFNGNATVFYSDKTSADVTDKIVIEKQPNMYEAGTTRAIFSYTEDEVTVTANFDIEITGAVPTGAKPIAYKYIFNLTNYEQETIAHIDIDKSVLPAYGIPGKTVTLTVVPENGWTVYEVNEPDWAIEDSTSLGNNVFTFTMPQYIASLDVMFVVGQIVNS